MGRDLAIVADDVELELPDALGGGLVEGVFESGGIGRLPVADADDDVARLQVGSGERAVGADLVDPEAAGHVLFFQERGVSADGSESHADEVPDAFEECGGFAVDRWLRTVVVVGFGRRFCFGGLVDSLPGAWLRFDGRVEGLRR